jgi:hypothetical protein
MGNRKTRANTTRRKDSKRELGKKLVRPKLVGGVYRCVVCNDRFDSDEGSKLLMRGSNLILCPECVKVNTYYHNRKYVRANEYQTTWKHQRMLTDTLVKIFGKAYIVDEVKFVEWGISRKGGFLSYDIAIPRYNILVDYHGEYHFSYPNPFHHSIEEYENQVRNDKLKGQLAVQNNWTYMVFSYNEPVFDESWVRRRLSSVISI